MLGLDENRLDKMNWTKSRSTHLNNSECPTDCQQRVSYGLPTAVNICFRDSELHAECQRLLNCLIIKAVPFVIFITLIQTNECMLIKNKSTDYTLYLCWITAQCYCGNRRVNYKSISLIVNPLELWKDDVVDAPTPWSCGECELVWHSRVMRAFLLIFIAFFYNFLIHF